MQPLFTWLLALGPASELPPFSPAFSCPPLQTLPLHPHSAIIPPPDLFHLSSPAGPQLSLSLSLLSSSLYLPSHSPPGSLSFLTSVSKPPILPIPTLPDPWVSLRSPSLRQRQMGVGPGARVGTEPHSCPSSPFLYNLINSCASKKKVFVFFFL